MVKDPWPMNWKIPSHMESDHSRRQLCRYNKRKPMLCDASKRDACRTCYFKQMSITDEQNKVRKWAHNLLPIIHYCDRCGRQIGQIDHIVYLEPEDRNGTTLLSMELCYGCALMLLNWAGGEDFLLPEVDEDTLDFFYPVPEEKPAPKPRKKKPRKRKHYKHSENFDYFKSKRTKRLKEEETEWFQSQVTEQSETAEPEENLTVAL